MPYDPGRDTNPPSDTPTVPDSYTQAWQRLISHAAPQDELVSLLEIVFSSGKITELIDGLQGEHTQTFINVMDAVRHQTSLLPEDDN